MNMEKEGNISTEEKIKEAAKRVFQQKGYGLTRTRDIAEEAGINLALLNYYYRSKKKLFDIIMHESVKEMLTYIENIINNKNTTLSEKIDAGVNRYIEGISKNPHLPIFIFSELQANPQQLFDRVGASDGFLKESYMFKQIQEQIDKKGLKFSPIQFFINMVSLSIFPILGQPFLKNVYKMEDKEYVNFIKDRIILVPIWLKSMLKLDE